jgi:hypothetical protein
MDFRAIRAAVSTCAFLSLSLALSHTAGDLDSGRTFLKRIMRSTSEAPTAIRLQSVSPPFSLDTDALGNGDDHHDHIALFIDDFAAVRDCHFIQCRSSLLSQRLPLRSISVMITIGGRGFL